ncbi:MAG: hypothetical protein V4591_02750 [Bdellovibrionota bacterium]
MKKQNKFSTLSTSELLDKQKTLLKQLVTFKVSLDPSTITESNNIDGLRKDVKSIQRQIALVSSSTKAPVGG